MHQGTPQAQALMGRKEGLPKSEPIQHQHGWFGGGWLGGKLLKDGKQAGYRLQPDERCVMATRIYIDDC